MKELLVVRAENCTASEEVLPAVKLFMEQNPDVRVLDLNADSDRDYFEARTGGETFFSTPMFVALENGKILDRHQGKLCEVRLAKMFTSDNEEQSTQIENIVEASKDVYVIGEDGLRIGQKELVFFSGSWCEYCKAMDNVVSQFSEKHPEIFVRKLDVESDAEEVKEHCYDTTIYGVPTFFAVVDQTLSPKAVYNGVTDVAGLEQLFNK